MHQPGNGAGISYGVMANEPPSPRISLLTGGVFTTSSPRALPSRYYFTYIPAGACQTARWTALRCCAVPRTLLLLPRGDLWRWVCGKVRGTARCRDVGAALSDHLTCSVERICQILLINAPRRRFYTHARATRYCLTARTGTFSSLPFGFPRWR